MYIAKSFALSVILVCGQVSAKPVMAADGVPVFTKPPSAQELANILFPLQTRSIVMGNAPEDATTGNEFAVDGAPGSENGSVNHDAPAVPLGNSDSESAGAFGLLINFEYGKATVTSESLDYLDAVGEMLKLEQTGSEAILIEGHTDGVGSLAFNQKLSEQRALAVRRYLISAHEISAIRLHSVGYGETSLHDTTNPEAAINRRVEFRLLDRDDS